MGKAPWEPRFSRGSIRGTRSQITEFFSVIIVIIRVVFVQNIFSLAHLLITVQTWCVKAVHEVRSSLNVPMNTLTTTWIRVARDVAAPVVEHSVERGKNERDIGSENLRISG